ncbi:glycosyltransferase family 4 protein, partial [Hyphococcus sp.]|uniref:glycosyltransferase family 4 protein n=1 Tax=Hyphococcus sp. TaxID=2038636 RepID=UPI00375216FA
VDVTLEAIRQMRKALPNLKVVAFGASPLSNKLPLPSGSSYHLHPAQHKIRDIYAQCDVWISGSRVEGFNLPPLEAMACRTPVVATAAGALPELVQNGAQGYVVPIEDAHALAEKTLSILQGADADWRRMSDAAYATASSYSWDDAGALFEAALLDAVAAERKANNNT